MAEDITENPRGTEPPDIPEAVAAPKSRRTVQLVWLIPIIAALVGGWLAIKSVLDRGPVVTITFKTAEGLEAGKTKVKYKDVDIGLVQSITLSKDRSGVVATAELVKDAKPMLVEDVRFWVVRPRISGGSVSGIGTLLSGSYIGVDVGKGKEPTREYTGLEVPPAVSTDAPGREYVLRGADMGSLAIGTPVFFRRLQVGQITAYEINKDGKGVTLKAFVNAPYDQYVNPNTRFWHASGIDVTLDATGFRVESQSIVSILLGGIAFETPARSAVLSSAESGAVFELYVDRAAAMKHPDTIADSYVMVFNESVRGLVPGAPVDFRGIVVGEVVSIGTRFDPATAAIALPVEIKFYPERFSSRAVSGPKTGRMAKDPKAVAEMMVRRGMRAQVRTGNLLTGQRYIALDFFPDAPKATIDWSMVPPEFPTTPGSLEDLLASATGIAKKLDKVDFEAISTNLKQTLQSGTKLIQRLDTETAADLRETLQSATKLLRRLDAETVPGVNVLMEDARRALASADRVLASDSPPLADTREAMREIARAARAFRLLGEYLEQHPEALIRGKTEDAK